MEDFEWRCNFNKEYWKENFNKDFDEFYNIPIWFHDNIWEFYNFIGWDYRKKKFIKEIT